MPFQRKLFTLLARPRGGGGGGGSGGGGGLSESDVDFVIELIDRQNEIGEERPDHDHGHGEGHGTGGGSSSGNQGSSDDPCDDLRKNLSQALRDGNFALAESISRAYTRCRSTKRPLRKLSPK